METESKTSHNGWQNIGISMQFASDHVPFKLTALFFHIVSDSFGKRSASTSRRTQADWAKHIGISRPTFTSQIHELEALGLVKINTSSKFIENGGSEAYSYSPVFPEGYGYINLDGKSSKSSTTSGSQLTEDDVSIKNSKHYDRKHPLYNKGKDISVIRKLLTEEEDKVRHKFLEDTIYSKDW